MIYLNSMIKKFKLSAIKTLKKIKKALSKESLETKQMLEIYLNYTKGKSSKEEMQKANEQFRELLKTLGIGIFAILPLAFLTIPLVVSLGKKFNIDILPSYLKESNDL